MEGGYQNIRRDEGKRNGLMPNTGAKNICRLDVTKRMVKTFTPFSKIVLSQRESLGIFGRTQESVQVASVGNFHR